VRQDAGGDWNNRGVGIELVDDQFKSGWYTIKQEETLVELMKYLVETYNIPLDRKHIVMHSEIQRGKSDPWGWTDREVQLIIKLIIEDNEMTDEMAQKLIDAIKMQNLLIFMHGDIQFVKPDPKKDACYLKKGKRLVLVDDGSMVKNGLTWSALKI